MDTPLIYHIRPDGTKEFVIGTADPAHLPSKAKQDRIQAAWERMVQRLRQQAAPPPMPLQF